MTQRKGLITQMSPHDWIYLAVLILGLIAYTVRLEMRVSMMETAINKLPDSIRLDERVGSLERQQRLVWSRLYPGPVASGRAEAQP